MKILHITEVQTGGTISVISHLVASQIVDQRFSRVSCIAPIGSQGAFITAGLANIFLYKRTGRNISSFARLLWTVIKALLKERPNIVHLHSTYAGFLTRLFLGPIFLLLRTRIIYCPHGYSFLMEGSSLNKLIYSLLEYLLSFIPQKIICVSQFEHDKAVSIGISSKKIHVVYNGVCDLGQVQKQSVKSSSLVEFIFLGRNDRAKGFDVLLKAMAFIKGNSRVRLTVVGIAADEIKNSDQLMNVRFMGWLDAEAVKHQLKQSDVLVLPSRWEGFPMAALEAMSAGLPVLASNCTSIPEAVEHGVNGFIVPVEDFQSLANVMTTTPLEVWYEMGANARSKYELHYRASRMTEATFDVYLSMFN